MRYKESNLIYYFSNAFSQIFCLVKIFHPPEAQFVFCIRIKNVSHLWLLCHRYQENTELNLEKTAECLDLLRFFYKVSECFLFHFCLPNNTEYLLPTSDRDPNTLQWDADPDPGNKNRP